MLGIAMGCIGMSYGDFCRLTPEEFGHVFKAWQDARESAYRDGWERARMVSAILIQPHVKKRITPHGLLPFAWDGNPVQRGKPVGKEEARKRFEELVKRCR